MKRQNALTRREQKVKTIFFILACCTLMAAPARAHTPPDTPANPGPVPDILIDNTLLMWFDDLTVIPISVNADNSIFWVEVMPNDLEKSFSGGGAWAWEEGEYCMYLSESVICFPLDEVITPGKAYDSTARYMNLQGEEQARMDFKVMLIRKEE